MMYPTPPRGYKGTGVVYSDSQGKFSIHGLVGNSVSFSSKRAGYQSGGAGLGADFDPRSPGSFASPATPQTLLLWKNKGAEELVAIEESHFKAPLQGSVLIDLLTGGVVPSGGDLKVTFDCPPQLVATDGRREWSCTIEAIDGGIRRAPNLETFNSILEARIPTGFRSPWIKPNPGGIPARTISFICKAATGESFRNSSSQFQSTRQTIPIFRFGVALPTQTALAIGRSIL